MNESTTDNNTRRIILDHLARYPKMQIVDFFKLLFHSALGCEHAVSSLERATEYIAREYSEIGKDSLPLCEELDGEYCRVYLGYLSLGITPRELADAFCASAKIEEQGRRRLEEKLVVLRDLAEAGDLPFDLDAFDSMVSEWRDLGYPAVRHSETYREKYKPAYRVVSLDEAEKLLAKLNDK